MPKVPLMDETPEEVVEARHQAWLAEKEQELHQALAGSLVHFVGRAFDPDHHRLAVDVAEALARCGLWLNAAPEGVQGGVSIGIGVGLLGLEDTDQVVVGWTLPDASVTRPYERHVHELMRHALSELLALMGFGVDRHKLLARGIEGLIVIRKPS